MLSWGMMLSVLSQTPDPSGRGMKLVPMKNRLALVIGNANYNPIPVRTSQGIQLLADLCQGGVCQPINDAQAIKGKLTSLGFRVILGTDLSRRAMRDSVRTFIGLLENDAYEDALLFYAGHGVEIDGVNYLLPIIQPNERIDDKADIEDLCVDLYWVLDKMNGTQVQNKIVFLDACRTNPFRNISSSRGWSNMTASGEMFIGFGSAPGQSAANIGENGKNGAFTEALLQYIDAPNISIHDMFMRVGGFVKKTQAAQVVFTSSSMTKPYYFNPIQIQSPPHPEDIPGFAFVKGGSFMMGCDPERDGYCESDETLHKVTVSSFYLMRYEVTNKEYCEFLNATGRDKEGDKVWLDIESSYCLIEKGEGVYRPKAGFSDHPVVEVTWYGASAYARWYARKTGDEYRLPTEAEWEYAARGGIKSRGYKYAGSSDNLALYGNFCDKNCVRSWKIAHANDGYLRTAPVGSFRANELGLYDMSGNVWEWCSDWYGDYGSEPRTNPTGATSGSSRVVRGGSWRNIPVYLRVADRRDSSPTLSTEDMGFRLLRTAVDF